MSEQQAVVTQEVELIIGNSATSTCTLAVGTQAQPSDLPRFLLPFEAPFTSRGPNMDIETYACVTFWGLAVGGCSRESKRTLLTCWFRTSNFETVTNPSLPPPPPELLS